MKQSKPTHGGKRTGAGKPPKDPEQGARVKVSITLSKKHHKMTDGNRSDIIEKALDKYIAANPALIELHGSDGPKTMTSAQPDNSGLFMDEMHQHENPSFMSPPMTVYEFIEHISKKGPVVK